MPDSRDLEARLSALEDRVALPRRGWGAALLLALIVISVAGLLFQLWLMQRQQESLRTGDRARLFWTVCQPSNSMAERTAAFTRLVAGGHTEWRSAASQGLDLRGSQLDGASLRLADLSACDLRSASLIEADFSGARLRTADLSGADLTEAVLDGADCLKATLEKADFHKARLRSVSLEQTQARKATFVLADLSEALLLMADLSGADFTGADLTAATLESARLRGATLSLTNLAGADLKNADLTDSNWWRARGLTTAQLVELAAEYPPTDAADPSRIKDYLLWADAFAAPSAPAGREAARPAE